MPNLAAWIALAATPFVVLAAFALRRDRASFASTTAWAMALGLMFLPSAVAFDAPLLPKIDKHSLTFLSILLAQNVVHGHRLRRGAELGFPRWIVAALLAAAAVTARNNQDPLVYGALELPGLTAYDVASTSIALLLDTYVPFVVGLNAFRTEQDLADLLGVLSKCALVYAPLVLFEVRFSPQLHNWIYGFHPSDFAQAVRGGGYRPIVFMNHGLSVAMFLLICMLAGVGLHAAGSRRGMVRPGARAAIAAGLLVMCKSLGSLVYASFALAGRWVLSSRGLGGALAVVCCLVVAYPATRMSGMFPTERLVDAFRHVDPERAGSLRFRFEHEDALVRRALERPAFGWGSFGRNRVYDERGRDTSITDGLWVIRLGSYGIVGLLGFMALLVVPVVRFARLRSRMTARSQVLCGTLATILAIVAVDLLPNSLSDRLPVALAGALFVTSGRLSRRTHVPATAPPPKAVASAAGGSTR